MDKDQFLRFRGDLIVYNARKRSLLYHYREYVACHRSMTMILYLTRNYQVNDGRF